MASTLEALRRMAHEQPHAYAARTVRRIRTYKTSSDQCFAVGTQLNPPHPRLRVDRERDQGVMSWLALSNSLFSGFQVKYSPALYARLSKHRGHNAP